MEPILGIYERVKGALDEEYGSEAVAVLEPALACAACNPRTAAESA